MRVHHKVLGLSVFTGLMIWFIDALLDHLFFYRLDFWDLLILDIPEHELYIRLLILAAFIVFGLIISKVLFRYETIHHKLRDREQELSLTLTSIADAVIATDFDCNITFINSVAEELTGWKNEDACGHPLTDVFEIYDENGSKIDCPASNAMKTEKSVSIPSNAELKVRDGRRIPVEDSIAPIIDEDDEIIGSIIVFRDVSAKRESEEWDKYYAAVLSNISEAVITADTDYRIKSWNKGAEQIYGWKAEEAIGKTLPELIPTEYPDQNKDKVLDQYRKNGYWKGEVIQKTQDGRELYILASASIIKDSHGKPHWAVTINRDITERVEAEKELRRSEEKFRMLSDQSLLALLIYSARGLVYGNRAFADLLDMTEKEMEKMSLEQILSNVHPDDREFVTKQARGKIAGDEGTTPRYTFRMKTKKNNVKWVDLFSRKLVFQGEQSVFATIVDISERVAAQRALAEEKERLDVTLRSIGDGVIATDNSGKIIQMNSAAENLTGWSEQSAFGKDLAEVFEIINEESREAVENPVRKVLNTGSVVALDDDTVLITKDGRERIIADSGAPIRDKNGDIIGVVLVFRDFTETKRLQEFATRAQRLETAGRIAAQVAHDFNNLLGPLTAYPALIKDDLPAEHPAQELIDQIEKSANQMAEINQQLLTLGRRGHYALKPLDLNKIVKQIVRQFHSISQTIAIKTDLDDNLFNIRGGVSQIYRVLSNLISNAFDAMPNSGKLKIKTENFYADEISSKAGGVPKGEYVKLSVSDSGSGIPYEVMPKIFDPFFTTKTAEGVRGSGLGLSVVHSVIEDHGGFIDFESAPGQGTTFFIYFPITRESVETKTTSGAMGGSEKILIVDDDSTQREVARILLSKLGYKTQTADSGEQALKLMKNQDFDIVVLDMIMPGGMQGAETYEKMLELNPDQKAIIVSGYAESDQVNKAMKLGARAFIRKPVTIKLLGSAVRKALDEPVRSRKPM
ncbi:MAG: PAS domain S-box protein [candidate division Zixibacteria bacterium]|nr:PAS domain S-box protein [candidate division Zixibacteria bacterium]